MALDQPELSPRELATRFRHDQLLRLGIIGLSILKAHDLITSPAFIVIKAADEFKDKTTAPNQLWQTDFTNHHARAGRATPARLLLKRCLLPSVLGDNRC